MICPHGCFWWTFWRFLVVMWLTESWSEGQKSWTMTFPFPPLRIFFLGKSFTFNNIFNRCRPCICYFGHAAIFLRRCVSKGGNQCPPARNTKLENPWISDVKRPWTWDCWSRHSSVSDRVAACLPESSLVISRWEETLKCLKTDTKKDWQKGGSPVSQAPVLT